MRKRKFRSWARPWMVWLTGYPVTFSERIIQAHRWAVMDVREAIEKLSEARDGE